MTSWVLWSLALVVGATTTWALARWVEPVGASRATRAVSAVLVTVAVMSAVAWTGASVSLHRAAPRVVKEWTEAAVRSVPSPGPELLASLRPVPHEPHAYPAGCAYVDRSPPGSPYSTGGSHCNHNESFGELSCPVGRFQVSRRGGYCFADNGDDHSVSRFGWRCGSGSVHGSSSPTTPLYSLRRSVSLRLSPDGRFAEYTCQLDDCTVFQEAGSQGRPGARVQRRCSPQQVGYDTPPPLYLARTQVRRRASAELFPMRWRGETARLALLSTLLGLLAVLLERRSVEPLRTSSAPSPRLPVPYRALESSVDGWRPTLDRVHARRLIALLVVYGAVSVAMIRWISP